MLRPMGAQWVAPIGAKIPSPSGRGFGEGNLPAEMCAPGSSSMVLPVSGIFCIFAPSLNSEFHNFWNPKMAKPKTFAANRVCVCV